jgi:hypothetical protein
VLRREPLVELGAYAVPIQHTELTHRFDRLTFILYDETGDAVLENLRHRAVFEGDHGGAARHGFDHHQTEGLAPCDRKQQARGIAEKLALLMLADFTDEFDVPLRQKRLYRGLEIFFVDLVDFRRDLQRHAGTGGNADRRIRRLFRRYAAEEGQISPGARSFDQQIPGKAMKNRCNVVRLRQRFALRV